MVAFRTIFSSVLAPVAILSQSVLAAGLFEFESHVSNHSLVARQDIVDAGVCATVDITLPRTTVALVTLGPIVIAQGVCICAQAGAITPASLLTLDQTISAQGGVAGQLVNLLGGATTAVTTVANALAPVILGLPAAECPYPANSVANECGGCGYVCQTDFTLDDGLCCAADTTASNGVCCGEGLVGCNGQCVTAGSLCCRTGTIPSNGVCCPSTQFGCNGGCLDAGSLCCANGQQPCNGNCIAASSTCCPAGQFACNGECVDVGTDCASGVARRNFNSATCPLGFEACRIPSSPRSKNFGPAFECINTASDLESCGGCVVPTFGRPQGQDCSAIPDVDSAICQAGRCVIESCARGFTSTGTACIKTESSGRKLSGYWAALEEASHVILQK